jgi:hypothetical protein
LKEGTRDAAEAATEGTGAELTEAERREKRMEGTLCKGLG